MTVDLLLRPVFKIAEFIRGDSKEKQPKANAKQPSDPNDTAEESDSEESHGSANTRTRNPDEQQQWVSPFTREKVDPKYAKKDKQAIAAGFPTKSELRNVIPPHSTFWSLAYVLRDICQGILVVYITYHVVGLRHDPPEGVGMLSWQYLVWRLAWNIYGIVMGFAVGGLWV